MLKNQFVHAGAVTILGALLTACGGSGGDTGDWLFPLWVNTDVKTADIDGDGLQDVITIAQLASSMQQREGRLVLLRQSAPSVFAAPQTYTVGRYPWKLAVADIDGDGAPDLVVPDPGQSNTGSPGGSVWLLKQNTGNRGTFLPAQRLLDTAATPYGLAIGNVNGDGAPDLMITSPVAGVTGATLLAQDATRRGNFLAPPPISLPSNPAAVTIGDLNGDGRHGILLRISLSVSNGNRTTVLGSLYQQAGGSLASWVELPSPKSGVNSQLLSLTDLNGDSIPDIVEFFTPCCTGYLAHAISLIQAPALGSFTRIDSSLAGIDGIDSAAIADLDQNGKPDLATAGSYPVGSPRTVQSSLHILLQDGSGAFHIDNSFSMPIPAHQLAAGDLNCDGRTDLVVLGGGNQVLALLQSGTTPGTFLAPQFLK